jgi:hypothetical protein
MLNAFTRVLTASMAAAVFVTAASPAAAAEKLSKKPYVNTEYGFVCYVPDGWVSVPPQPGEKTMLMKFQSNAASKGWDFYKSELEILYIRRKKVELEDKHAGGTKSTKYERNDAAFKDYAESHYVGCNTRAACSRARSSWSRWRSRRPTRPPTSCSTTTAPTKSSRRCSARCSCRRS